MRYTPFETMDRLFEQMRREMSDAGEPWGDEPSGWSGGRGHDLGMDLTEHDGEFVFTADLPGFEREEIDLTYDDGYLLLSAVHESSGESTSRSRSVTERIAIPGEVVADEITASYHNGVLEVHLPLEEETGDPGHSIDIE